jgi:hypothetical protein
MLLLHLILVRLRRIQHCCLHISAVYSSRFTFTFLNIHEILNAVLVQIMQSRFLPLRNAIVDEIIFKARLQDPSNYSIILHALVIPVAFKVSYLTNV